MLRPNRAHGAAHPPLAPALLALGAVVWILGATAGARAASLSPPAVLVGDGASGQLTVLSGGSLSGIPAPVAGGITAMGAGPQGQTVFVTFGSGYLAQFESASDSYLGAPLFLGADSEPDAVAVTGNGQDLWVGEGGASRVVEVATASMSAVGQPISVPGAANLALSPDGADLFVDGGPGSTGVSAVDTATGQVTNYPAQMPGPLALSPDQERLYVLSETQPQAQVLVLDPRTGTALVPPVALTLTPRPQTMALGQDGAQLYVSGGESGLASLDTASWSADSLPTALPLELDPTSAALALSPNGSTAYLAVGSAQAGSGYLSTVPPVGAGEPSLTSGIPDDPVALVVVPSSTVGPLPGATPSPTASPTPSCVAPSEPTPVPVNAICSPACPSVAHVPVLPPAQSNVSQPALRTSGPMTGPPTVAPLPIGSTSPLATPPEALCALTCPSSVTQPSVPTLPSPATTGTLPIRSAAPSPPATSSAGAGSVTNPPAPWPPVTSVSAYPTSAASDGPSPTPATEWQEVKCAKATYAGVSNLPGAMPPVASAAATAAVGDPGPDWPWLLVVPVLAVIAGLLAGLARRRLGRHSAI